MEEIRLIKYRDSGMHTYTYFWVTAKYAVISPYFDTETEAMEWKEGLNDESRKKTP
jgi:hypothetical protein